MYAIGSRGQKLSSGRQFRSRIVVSPGRHETDDEALAAALNEYVKRLGRLKILDLVGTIDCDPDYDYKAQRRRKRQ